MLDERTHGHNRFCKNGRKAGKVLKRDKYVDKLLETSFAVEMYSTCKKGIIYSIYVNVSSVHTLTSLTMC